MHEEERMGRERWKTGGEGGAAPGRRGGWTLRTLGRWDAFALSPTAVR